MAVFPCFSRPRRPAKYAQWSHAVCDEKAAESERASDNDTQIGSRAFHLSLRPYLSLEFVALLEITIIMAEKVLIDAPTMASLIATCQGSECDIEGLIFGMEKSRFNVLPGAVRPLRLTPVPFPSCRTRTVADGGQH